MNPLMLSLTFRPSLMTDGKVPQSIAIQSTIRYGISARKLILSYSLPKEELK
jgi:hypothetical protein